MEKNANLISVLLLFVFILLAASIAQSTVLKDVYDIISDIDNRLKKGYDQELANYKHKLEEWIDFSPSSFSGRAVNATLCPLDSIDLESGHISGVSHQDKKWDLVFGTGSEGVEYLRALSGATWHEKGVSYYQTIKYRDIRDAMYSASINTRSGYPDIFSMHRSNVPTNGFVYFIKTAEGNVVKFQILGYENVMSGNQIDCRNMKILYEVFPIISDPPLPQKPQNFWEKFKNIF